MSHAVPAARRALPALLAAVLAGGLLAPAADAAPKAPASGTKVYAASASPAVVPLGTAVTVTLTNCGPCDGAGPSNQSFGSAEVRFPTSAGLDAAGATARTASGATWSVAAGASGSTTVLRLTAGSAPAVEPGSSVALTIPVPATAAPGPVTFATQVKQSNDFSGTGNDFARVGDDPTVHLGAGPAVGVEWVVGPSTVQVSPASTATSGLTPVLVMCGAPQVRLVDAFGNTAVGSTAVVTLTASGGGVRLDGSTTLSRTTVGGVATFGSADCSTGLTATSLGTGFSMTASAQLEGGTTSDVADDLFDVLPVYGDCTGETCSTGEVRGAQGTTSSVTATGGTGQTRRLTFSVGLDSWDDFAGACDPDPGTTGTNPYRDPVTVDLDDYAKTVELRWTKKAVQWATNNGASQWRVCLAAAYPFPGLVNGDEFSTTGTKVGDWYVAGLLACDDPRATGPCLRRLGRNAGEQIATVFIPDVEGDPRMI